MKLTRSLVSFKSILVRCYGSVARTGDSAYWGDASSLILAAKSPGSECSYDYKILMLKRNEASRFMPNITVFPGGAVDGADFNNAWFDYFNAFLSSASSNGLEYLASLTRKLKGDAARPCAPAYDLYHKENILSPPRLVFRVAAIREAFEETGIPLLKHKSCFQGNDPVNGYASVPHHLKDDAEMTAWRKKVHQDPQSFLDMCKEMDVIPDALALSEWSNWLTPVFKPIDEPPKKPNRFDTLFFICCMDHLPEAVPESSEIQALKWTSPRGILHQNAHDEDVRLIPPQLYEISRLHNFHKLDSLCKFSHARDSMGVERWIGFILPCDDGVVMTFEGDEAWKEIGSVSTSVSDTKFSGTMKELREKASILNRIERPHDLSQHMTVHCNVESVTGHVMPANNLFNRD